VQEEITLSKVIGIIYSEKKKIIIVTVLGMVISTVISLLFMSEKYEAVALVRVNASEQGLLNSLKESIVSDSTLIEIINTIDPNSEDFTLEGLKQSLVVSMLPNTNTVQVKATGDNPNRVTQLVNLLSFELGSRIEISDRSEKIVLSNEKLVDINRLLAMNTKVIEEIKNQLVETPEKIIVNKSIDQDPLLLNVLETQNNSLNGLVLKTEEINPVFVYLTSELAKTEIEYAKNLEDRRNTESFIETNNESIIELENTTYSEKLLQQSTERMLSGFNAVFISPAVTPEVPAGPNKGLNIILGTLIALMSSILFYLVKHIYVQNTLDSKMNTYI